MKITLRIIFLTVIISFVSTSYTATINGTVTDADKNPIVDAGITVYDEHGDVCAETWTGVKGTFTITNCMLGSTYRVRVVPLFHGVWEESISFTDDKDTVEVTGVCGVGYGSIYGEIDRKGSGKRNPIGAAVTYDGPEQGRIPVSSFGKFKEDRLQSGRYNFYIGARGCTPVVVSNIYIYTEEVTSNNTSLVRVDGKELSRKVQEAAYAENDGDFMKAIDIYKDVIRMQPCAKAYGNRAFLRLRAEKYTHAVSDFIQGLKWDPDSEWLKMGLGEAYEFADQPSNAIEIYTELLQEKPSDANIYRRRARASLAAGKTNDVMADLDMMLKKSDNSADAHYQRARIMYQMGLLKKAQAEINTALEKEPGNPDYHYFNAQLVYYIKTDDDAFNAVTRALEIEPGHIPSLKLLGVLYIEKEHWAGAERTYTHVISQDPMDAQAYSGRGKARLKQKKYEEAKKDYERACQLSPSSILGRLGLSNVLIEMQKYEEALTVLYTVLEMAPNDPIALYNRAQVYTALGMKSLAEEDMKQRTLSIKERSSY